MKPVGNGLVAMASTVCMILLSGCHGSMSASPVNVETPSIRISDPDDARWSLTMRQRKALKQAGFTQVSMPFGVLLAADEDMPPAYVTQSAAILAEMMDQDMDGVVDDPQVAAELARHDECWLAMPMDDRRWEEEQLPILERALGYDIIIPEWWMEVRSNTPDEHARAVMVEEIHHFMTQFGFSEVYPEIFGVDDWDSVIARETTRAQCDFWQHPENDCPGHPADYGGDCRDPSCDVVEFYQQVVVLRAGMEPGWLGIGFPEDRDELESRLSRQIKDVMDDPRYHQLRSPLQFDYPME